MVFEQLFSKQRILESFWYALLVAVVSTIIGIVIARFIFGANSGIVSVMFTSLLLIFILKDIFKDQELLEEKETKFSLKRFFVDNKKTLKTYLSMFIGVFLTYYLVSFLGVLLGFNVISILREQLLLDAGLIGQAGGASTFLSILQNNWWVLVAAFLLSVVAGSGGTFFIVWNASAWATIFGYRAAAASIVLNTNPFVTATLIQLFTFPHTLIEGFAYIMASVAGAVISTYVISSKKKVTIFTVSFFVLILLFWSLSTVLRAIFPQVLFTLIMILLFIGIISLLGNVFDKNEHRLVYKYNFYLFIASLIVFVIGAIVETFVLTNFSLLDRYYSAAYIYATIG